MRNEQKFNPEPEGDMKKKEMQNENLSEAEESFSFLKETIKPKTMNREKLFVQFMKMAVSGLLIGLFACFSFYMFKPRMEQAFGGDGGEVTIPADEEILEGEKVEDEPEEEEQKLTEEHYQYMMERLYLTAQEAKKSVVSVRIKSETSWVEETGKTNPDLLCSTGFIAAENRQEFLILADNSVCSGGTEWEILFADGSSLEASLKVQDKNRGLAVFGVPEDKISETMRNQIRVAELGNSNLVVQGDAVIGLGNLFGYEEGLGYGIASSVEYKEVFPDGQCTILATDIAIAQAGTGVLVNQAGEVIGLIRQGLFGEKDLENPEVTANAVGISDLKTVMELMLNGKNVPYAGIRGATVTAEVAEEQEIPEGLYVTQVESDSPAMAAGIQNGDVIQSVNGETVTGITSFETALLDCQMEDTVKVQAQRRGSGGYVDVTFLLNTEFKK